MDNFRSKLKRKKSSTDNIHPETLSRETRRQTELFSVTDTAEETRNSAWWSSDQLSAAESLWASTLKSALPSLEKQLWELVPDLPLPSQVRPAAPQQDERWCDLSAEVAPIPEPSSPPPETAPGPNPLQDRSSQSSHQEVPAAPICDGQPSSPQIDHLNGPTASSSGLSERQRTSVHTLEEAGPSGTASDSRGQDRNVDGLVRGQVYSIQMKRTNVKDKVATVDKKERMESVSGGGASGGGASRGEASGGGASRGGASGAGSSGAGSSGGDGGRLQTCPMCLMVFPLGFTQMDCDGHLAQCLSEMNVDMTW